MEVGPDPVNPTYTTLLGTAWDFGSLSGSHMAESSTHWLRIPFGLGQWGAAQTWVLPLVLGCSVWVMGIWSLRKKAGVHCGEERKV